MASVAHSAMAGLIGPLVGTSLKKILKSEISQTFEKTVIKKSRQSSIDSRARALARKNSIMSNKKKAPEVRFVHLDPDEFARPKNSFHF